MLSKGFKTFPFQKYKNVKEYSQKIRKMVLKKKEKKKIGWIDH